MLNSTISTEETETTETTEISELEKKLKALLIENEKIKKEKGRVLRQNGYLETQVKTLSFIKVLQTAIAADPIPDTNPRLEAMKRRRDSKLASKQTLKAPSSVIKKK
jgi:hypothetical protein